MKAFILCAGYATRLGTLTENTPKALLEVQGKSFLQLLLDNLNELPEIDEVVIISNHKFYKNFVDAKDAGKMVTDKVVTILDDGTSSNEDRLGAVGDVAFALNKIGYDGESMILVADNWFDFKISDIYKFYRGKDRGNTIFGKFETSEKVLRGGAVAHVDPRTCKVEHLQEKPAVPDGNYACGAFYIYNADTTKKIHKFMAEKEKDNHIGDAPGYFPAWLVTNNEADVYFYDIAPYHNVDVGTLDTYHNIDKIIDSCNREVENYFSNPDGRKYAVASDWTEIIK